MKKCNKELIKRLRKKGYVVKISEGDWINIQKSKTDFTNIEFYSCDSTKGIDYDFYTAHYFNKDYDFELPYNTESMINTIDEIFAYCDIERN